MKLFFALAIFFLSSGVYAAEFCQNLPNHISYTKISNNFDGSVYLESPKVFVAGEYLPLISHGSNSFNYNSPGEGFCKILKRQFVSLGRDEIAYSKIVWLNSDASLGNIYSEQGYDSISWIVCK